MDKDDITGFNLGFVIVSAEVYGYVKVNDYYP
jgi:hypothetical protein